MTLKLHCGRWRPIVCPLSGVFVTAIKECINREVLSLLPALTYPQWYTRLPVVHLVTQITRGLTSNTLLVRYKFNSFRSPWVNQFDIFALLFGSYARFIT